MTSLIIYIALLAWSPQVMRPAAMACPGSGSAVHGAQELIKELEGYSAI